MTLLSLRETVRQYGLLASKALGQNFLLDQNITDKIICLSLKQQNKASFSGCHVAEIGPGPGGLTRSILAAKPSSLTVVEADVRCIAIMEELKAQTEDVVLNIINGDALDFDFSKEILPPRQLISNLPYNISVSLLIGWLHQIAAFEAMTLMFQREVAMRINAPVCCKDYGRLSVIAQLTCNIDKLMELPPECFTPAPKIHSTVLLFRPKAELPSKDVLTNIEKITTFSFGQRRKMLRQSLKSYPRVLEQCENMNIPLTARAEELSPQDYLMLAQAL